jgi:carbon storage regulator
MELRQLPSDTRSVDQRQAKSGREGIMLVLSRKIGERIVILGEKEIVLTVLTVHGGRVRLGVEADASISIRRAELDQTKIVRQEPASRETHHAHGIAH